jgi:hypothetical protein
MPFADNGISFPISNPFLLLNNVWAIIYTDSVFESSSTLLATPISFSVWLLATQMATQITVGTLVVIYVPVYGFVADP